MAAKRERCTSPTLLRNIIQCSQLPMRLSFSESIYGISDFTEGAMIDVYFCKKTTMASVQLPSGKLLKVPINSKLTLNVHECAEVVSQAQTVSQSTLLQMNPKPQIVKIAEFKRSNRSGSMFSKSEILVIKKRVSCSQTIECYSLLTKTTKVISKSTVLQLQLEPVHTDLCFVDAVQHLSFPLSVRLHPCEKKFARYFMGQLKILGLVEENSTIASFVNSNKKATATSEIIEISTKVELNFVQVNLSENENKSLIRKTYELYDEFTPTRVHQVITNTMMALGSNIEQNIYHMHVTDSERIMNGIRLTPITVPKPKPDIVIPPKPKPDMVTVPKPKPDIVIPPKPKPDIVTVPKPKPDMVAPAKPSIPKRSLANIPLPTIPPVYIAGETSNKVTSTATTDAYEFIIQDFTHVYESPDCLKSVSTGHKMRIPTKSYKKRSVEESQGKHKTDIELEDIDQDGVLMILDNLGLAQYKSIFAQEQMSGDLLKQCTDDMLEDDLKVVSKLHRLKLNRVINGKVPLAPLLKPVHKHYDKII